MEKYRNSGFDRARYRVRRDGRRRGKNGQKRKDFELKVTQGLEGWVEFARQALACHGESKYKVSSRKPFRMKILAPPEKIKRYLHLILFVLRGLVSSCTCALHSVKNALDVDSVKEWDRLVGRLEEHRPSEINVFIDMKTVKECCKVVKRRNGQVNDESGGDTSKSDEQDADRSLSVCGSSPGRLQECMLREST